MIAPLKESAEAKGFVVCDIENRTDGGVIVIDTAWRDEHGGIFHRDDHSWDTWIAYIKRRASYDKRFRCIYAHGGGGWDWISLAAYLVKHQNPREEITCHCVDSAMVVLCLKTHDFTIVFSDSLKLLNSSLDKLAKAFLGEGKIEKPEWVGNDYELWSTKDPEGFKAYHRQDTRLLLLVLESTLDLLRKHVAKIDSLGYTIGSTALKVFKTIGISEPIAVPWRDDVREILRAGYYGGRNELFFPGIYERAFVYDVNSFYPHLMATEPVPISDRGTWGGAFDLDGLGVAQVQFCQRNRSVAPVLMIDGRGSYEGLGTFFTPELRLLKQIDPKGSIIIKQSFEFFDTAVLFKPFVDRLWKLREPDPNGPIGRLCKALMNPLSGKFSQKSEREKLCSIPLKEIYRRLGKKTDLGRAVERIKPISREYEIYSVIDSTHKCRFEHVGISGAITSAGRATLFRAGLDVGFEHVIYTDTDSLHVTEPMRPDRVGSALGQWQKEFEGAAAYAGKKLYALRDADSETVRVKGVSLGGDNGGELGFDDMCRIVSGGEKRVIYKRPSTVMEVFKGKRVPCRFYETAKVITATGTNRHEDFEWVSPEKNNSIRRRKK